MSGTNVLFGQIASVFGIVIAGVWSATQWTAAALGYQVRLGTPWFDLVFDAYAPQVFNTGGVIAGGSGLFAVVVAITMSIWRSRQSRLVTTYGSARWANQEDIRKAGLTQSTGVFLGQHKRQYLRHEGPEHVLTFAPTRSGKGVGLVIPTLLSWPASAVIHDIKGENWQITAGWRSRFSHCLLFNPTDEKSAPITHCWKYGAGRMKCATYKTLPIFWLTLKARWNGAIIGRKPATHYWSVRFCTCCMQAKTRRCAAWRIFCLTRPARLK